MAKKRAARAASKGQKRSTKAKPKKAPAIAPGEHIRVAPLHYPKPDVSIDGLAEMREEGGDLFDGKLHTIAAAAHLTYNNGPLLTSAQVFTVFWGAKWGSASAIAKITALNKFFKDILVSPLIDQLGEYSVPGQTIGHGAFIGTTTISAKAPVGSVADSVVRTQLKAWIKAKAVPKSTKNTLYFIYLDPGIVSIMGGSRSCQSYCGYHDHTGSIYYAVMPYPTCNGCLGGLNAIDALTGTSSHELCEAITDPNPGTGWYDNVNGEIGDICAWSFKTVSGHKVQLEWSNAKNKCV